MYERYTMDFNRQVRVWASIACKNWGFPEPSEQLFEKLYRRLPSGLLATIGFGINNGIIVTAGCTFSVNRVNKLNGSYNWFARDNTNHVPTQNWEYYIQVGEYDRLWQTFANSDHVITFEDSLMDIGVYKDNKLLVCCKIKEKSSQAQKLIAGIKAYETGIDLTIPDRGNDALRKAKYIVRLKPLFFYLVAIGVRYEFSVSFPKGKAFELRDDIIPFI